MHVWREIMRQKEKCNEKTYNILFCAASLFRLLAMDTEDIHHMKYIVSRFQWNYLRFKKGDIIM